MIWHTYENVWNGDISVNIEARNINFDGNGSFVHGKANILGVMYAIIAK